MIYKLIWNYYWTLYFSKNQYNFHRNKNTHSIVCKPNSINSVIHIQFTLLFTKSKSIVCNKFTEKQNSLWMSHKTPCSLLYTMTTVRDATLLVQYPFIAFTPIRAPFTPLHYPSTSDTFNCNISVDFCAYQTKSANLTLENL